MSVIVGDIHGCYEEFLQLIDKPLSEGRMIWSVGDLVDRGPYSPEVLKWFIEAREKGTADFVLGNHEEKFIRWLKGNKVKVSHGLQKTIDQLQAQPKVLALVKEYFSDVEIPRTLRVDENTLIVHAALHKNEKGNWDPQVCIYGWLTGETDSMGYPVRVDWAQNWTGDDTVVHGHVPVCQPRIVGKVVNVDTGCVFGGSLTMWDTVTKTTHSVPAQKAYAEYVGWFRE